MTATSIPVLLPSTHHTSIRNYDYRVVTLQISNSDIEEMDYHWNQSSMCDPTRSNAICSALNRIIRQQLSRPRVIMIGHSATAIVQGEKISLGEHLSAWLHRANRGLPVNPVSSMIWLPRSLISRRILHTPF